MQYSIKEKVHYDSQDGQEGIDYIIDSSSKEFAQSLAVANEVFKGDDSFYTEVFGIY